MLEMGQGHVLFDTIIEDRTLLGVHWKNAIKREAIALRTVADVGRAKTDGLEIVVKVYDDLAVISQLD
jgi:hypothetical protein